MNKKNAVFLIIGMMLFAYSAESVFAGCIDTDGGKNIYEKGTASSDVETQTDSCSSSTRLLERWCRTPDSYRPEGYYVDCPSGYTCSNGACVLTTPTCTDSDGGNDYFERGTCADNSGTMSDGCIVGGEHDGWLREITCQNNACNMVDYNCPNGCKDGACIEIHEACQNLLNRINTSFLKSCSDSGYDYIADVNNDKIVNVLDMTLVGQHSTDATWCTTTYLVPTDPCEKLAPDLTITSIDYVTSYPNVQIDRAIKNINEKVVYGITIKNLGNKEASSYQMSYDCGDNSGGGTGSVATLAPNAEKYFGVNCVYNQIGNYHVTATVNATADSNSGNNGAYAYIYVVNPDEDNAIKRNDYFVLGEKYLLQYKGADKITADSPVVKFKDVVTGETIEVTASSRNIKIGGSTYAFAPDTDPTYNDYNIRIDLNGDGNIGSTPTCTDSDNGKNYYVKGKVDGTFSDGTYHANQWDACCEHCMTAPSQEGPWVSEYYCDGNTAKREIYECPNGCKDGVCIGIHEVCQKLIDRINASFGKSCSDSGYDYIADVNNDKIVNVLDMTLVGQHSTDATWCTTTYLVPTYPCEGNASDLSIEKLTFTPSSPAAGDLITFTVVVKNIGDASSSGFTRITSIICTTGAGGTGSSGSPSYNTPSIKLDPGVSYTYTFSQSFNTPQTCTVTEQVFDKDDNNDNNNKRSVTVNVKDKTSCTDSDSGKDYYVKGTTSSKINRGLDGEIYTHDEIKDFEDSCCVHCLTAPSKTGPYLREGWCEGGVAESTFYECPNGCEDGACLPLEEGAPEEEIPPQFPKETFENKITLNSGWNLIGSFLISGNIELITDCDENNNVQAAYFYDPVNKKYFSESDTYTTIPELMDKYLIMDKPNSFWIKVRDSCSIKFEISEPYGWLNETQRNNKKLAKGWNLLSVVPDMVDKKLNDFTTGCGIKTAYGWNPFDREWEDIRNIDFAKDAVGYGFVVQTANECVLNPTITPSNVGPPEFPT